MIEVDVLQGSMQKQAEKFLLPSRFTTSGQGGLISITDSVTGRSTEVALCDYAGARKALGQLFPE